MELTSPLEMTLPKSERRGVFPFAVGLVNVAKIGIGDKPTNADSSEFLHAIETHVAFFHAQPLFLGVVVDADDNVMSAHSEARLKIRWVYRRLLKNSDGSVVGRRSWASTSSGSTTTSARS